MDRGDTCERYMIDLLVVGLQDELAEGAAAVSVNLWEAAQSKKKKKRKINSHTKTSSQFSEGATFHTQGLMSPYLRASMTNFRQSPMS